MPKDYSSKEVADILGISKKTLYSWEQNGKLPFSPKRDVRNWRVYSEKEVAWLKKNVRRLLYSRGGA